MICVEKYIEVQKNRRRNSGYIDFVAIIINSLQMYVEYDLLGYELLVAKVFARIFFLWNE